MSDAFKNYNALISGINQENQFRDSATRAVADAKQKADEMGKTIGEVKSFLSGQHGARGFVKDIKPILKKRAERLAEKAKAEIEARIKGKAQELSNRVAQARTEAEQRLSQGRQAVQDRFDGNGTPEANESTGDTTENPTQAEPAGENVNTEYDDWDTPHGEETGGGEAQDGYDDWDTPGTGDANDFDEWDSPWGDDTLTEGRAGTFNNPIANGRANKQNPTEQDSQNPMEARSEPPSYEESFDASTQEKAPGASPVEKPTDPTPPYQAPNPNEPTGGQGDGALSNESQMTNVAPKATGAGDQSLADGAKQEVEQSAKQAVAKSVEKTAVKTGAEEGGEEAGLSILDAVPGLDLLGFLGGGILAAIEAHKQRKEERIEEAGATGLANQAVQVGVGGE